MRRNKFLEFYWALREKCFCRYFTNQDFKITMHVQQFEDCLTFNSHLIHLQWIKGVRQNIVKGSPCKVIFSF